MRLFILIAALFGLTAAASTRYSFISADPNHVTWDLRRFIDLALHDAGLADEITPVLHQYSGLTSLIISVPSELSQSFACALKLSDRQQNYWIDMLRGGRDEKYVILDTATGQREGRGWHALLTGITGSVSLFECE